MYDLQAPFSNYHTIILPGPFGTWPCCFGTIANPLSQALEGGACCVTLRVVKECGTVYTVWDRGPSWTRDEAKYLEVFWSLGGNEKENLVVIGIYKTKVEGYRLRSRPWLNWTNRMDEYLNQRDEWLLESKGIDEYLNQRWWTTIWIKVEWMLDREGNCAGIEMHRVGFVGCFLFPVKGDQNWIETNGVISLRICAFKIDRLIDWRSFPDVAK